jgi:hypothetical protein
MKRRAAAASRVEQRPFGLVARRAQAGKNLTPPPLPTVPEFQAGRRRMEERLAMTPIATRSKPRCKLLGGSGTDTLLGLGAKAVLVGKSQFCP